MNELKMQVASDFDRHFFREGRFTESMELSSGEGSPWSTMDSAGPCRESARPGGNVASNSSLLSRRNVRALSPLLVAQSRPPTSNSDRPASTSSQSLLNYRISLAGENGTSVGTEATRSASSSPKHVPGNHHPEDAFTSAREAVSSVRKPSNELHRLIRVRQTWGQAQQSPTAAASPSSSLDYEMADSSPRATVACSSAHSSVPGSSPSSRNLQQHHNFLPRITPKAGISASPRADSHTQYTHHGPKARRKSPLSPPQELTTTACLAQIDQELHRHGITVMQMMDAPLSPMGQSHSRSSRTSSRDHSPKSPAQAQRSPIYGLESAPSAWGGWDVMENGGDEGNRGVSGEVVLRGEQGGSEHMMGLNSHGSGSGKHCRRPSADDVSHMLYIYQKGGAVMEPRQESLTGMSPGGQEMQSGSSPSAHLFSAPIRTSSMQSGSSSSSSRPKSPLRPHVVYQSQSSIHPNKPAGKLGGAPTEAIAIPPRRFQALQEAGSDGERSLGNSPKSHGLLVAKPPLSPKVCLQKSGQVTLGGGTGTLGRDTPNIGRAIGLNELSSSGQRKVRAQTQSSATILGEEETRYASQEACTASLLHQVVQVLEVEKRKESTLYAGGSENGTQPSSLSSSASGRSKRNLGMDVMSLKQQQQQHVHSSSSSYQSASRKGGQAGDMDQAQFGDHGVLKEGKESKHKRRPSADFVLAGPVSPHSPPTNLLVKHASGQLVSPPGLDQNSIGNYILSSIDSECLKRLLDLRGAKEPEQEKKEARSKRLDGHFRNPSFDGLPSPAPVSAVLKERKSKKEHRGSFSGNIHGLISCEVEGKNPTEYVLRAPYQDIAKTYLLHRKEIGNGQFGVIRPCLELSTGHVYACKTISKGSIKSPEDADDIRKEVACLESMRNHPTIITLKETVEDSKNVHIIMELCKGGDLFDRIKGRGRLAEANAARLCRTLVEALLHCHCNGIIHRDIKPENILLCEPDNDYKIRLVDFGVATFFNHDVPCTEVLGTPEYMAPEVLLQSYGPEADIWSAGVVLYIMMCGVPPFWASSKRSVEEAILKGDVSFKSTKWAIVSEPCKHLIKRMLQKDPKKRISALEILGHPWIQMYS